MRILGIYAGHDASAAVVEDGEVLIALEEERLTGTKKQGGIPARAIMWICKYLKCNPWDFDKVMVATPNLHSGRTHAVDSNKVLEMYPDAELVPHHKAHAALAYSWSGWDECTVLTLDGGGEDYFGSVNYCKDGYMTRSASLRKDEDEAFGMLYYYVTEALGFTPNRHEGKVMGLAASGKDLGLFDGLFWVDGQHIRASGRREDSIVFQRINQLGVPPGQFRGGGYRENIAASCQGAFEKTLLGWVANNTRGKLAVSGGCFANVLTNMKIAHMVDAFYVAPPMMDDGLSIGAALCGFDPIPVKRQKHVYLGKLPLLQHQVLDYALPGFVAKAIVDGKIVGLFRGAMEFGPRALGNRTILADPRDASINKRLNQRLNRTEFMPFAPVILKEFAADILEDYEIGADNAPFMTSCWKVKDEWKRKIPAVVHVDGTARPQVISKEINPYYYDVVRAFFDLTGVPVLINTSFNGHEDPIICFQNEAEWALETKKVDMVVRRL